MFVLVACRGGRREAKGVFRTLRSPTQGSALRTRKPFEKGLRESFSSPPGREFLLIVEDAGAQIAFTGIGQHNHDGFALELELFCQFQCSADGCAG